LTGAAFVADNDKIASGDSGAQRDDTGRFTGTSGIARTPAHQFGNFVAFVGDQPDRFLNQRLLLPIPS